MASPDTNRSQFGFWLLIALIALIAAERIVLSDSLDPDAFWHLRVAEQLHRDGIGPLVDDISYTSIRTPWTPYSWLAELEMRSIWSAGGLRGAVITHIVLAMTIVLICALECQAATRDQSDRAIPIAIAVLLAALWTQPFVAFRPVSAAIVLLSICAWLLLRDRQLDQRWRAIWLIPPILALTVNIHFFAMLAPCWIGALLLGALIEHDRRSVRRYAVLLLGSTIALFATPMLPGMLRAVTNFAHADLLVASGTISEMTYLWRNPPWGGILASTGAAAIIWLIIKRHEVHIGEWIWLAGMTILAARYARFTPLFAMISAPLLARTLPTISTRVLALKPLWAMLALVIAVTTYRVIAGIPPGGPNAITWLNRHGPGEFGYPIEAADYVDAHIPKRTGHLINGFNWGGYLAWRLPQFQVMADARTQLYSPDFVERFCFSDDGTTRATLADLIDTQGADAAILPRDDQHFLPCLREIGWQKVYEDDRAIVLAPSDARSR
jgi:hypothetical protein